MIQQKTHSHSSASSSKKAQNQNLSALTIRSAAALGAAALLLLGLHPAQAANGPDTWVGNTSALWSLAGNWTGTNTPPQSGDSLIFGVAGTAGATLNNDLTTAAFNIAGMTFNSGASAFTIAGNAFALTGGITNSSTNLQTINDAFSMASTQTFTTTTGGGNLKFGGVISGAGGLITAGAGTTTLSNSNTFTGGTTVNGGTLNLNAGGGNGAVRGVVTVNSGATLLLSVNNALGYTAGSQVTLVNINGGTVNTTGALSDEGYLTSYNLTGGTLAYTGSTAANEYQFAAADATAPGISSSASATTSLISGGLNIRSGNLGFNVAKGTTASGVDLNVTGLISSGGTYGIAKSGAGNLQLNNGADSFTGNVVVNAGTLSVNAGGTNGGATVLGSDAAAGRTITVNNGGTLSFLANNAFGSGTASAANIPTTIINSGGIVTSSRYQPIGAVTLNGGTLTQNSTDNGSYQGYQFVGNVTVGGTSASTISTGNAKGDHLYNNILFTVASTGAAGPDLTVSAPLLNGSGDFGSAVSGFTKAGAGTMALTGANTYTSATTISAGTLSLTGTLGSGGGTAISSAATLNEGAAGVIAGTSSLAVTGGTTTLSGANTYTGATSVSGTALIGGTLLLNGSGSLGATAVTVGNYGTLAVKPGINSATNALAGSLTLNAGSNFTMQDGATSTFNVTGASTLAPASGLSPVLSFDLSGTNGVTDLLNFTGAATNATNVSVAFDALSALTTGNTYTFITAGSGLTPANFVLGSSRVTFGTTAYNLSLSGTANSETVTIGTSGIPTVYYDGLGGTAALNAVTGGNTNFSTDAAGTMDAGGQPTVLSDVNFTATNVTTAQTIASLGQNYSVNSVNFLSGAPAITITDSTNSLTVNGGGITNAGASNQTLNVPVILGTASQTLSNTGTGILALGGTVSNGGFNLTTAGTGAINISGAISGTGSLINTGTTTLSASNNAYTGATIINGGTLTVSGGSNGAGGALSGTPTITVNSGGKLVLTNQDTLGYTAGKDVLVINSGGQVLNNGTAVRDTLQNTLTMTGGILGGTSAGDAGGAFSFDNQSGNTITATSDAAGTAALINAGKVQLQVANEIFNVTRGTATPTSDLTISSAINGGNGFTKTGNGILTLSGANTYTGATAVSAGTLNLTGSLTGSNVSTSGTGTFTEGTAGVIAGAGKTVTQGSTGSTFLNSPNTYTGGTTINSGFLGVGNATNSGTAENVNSLGTGTVTVNTGGTLALGDIGSTLAGFTIANAVTLVGGTVTAFDGVQTLSGGLNVTGTSILASTFNDGGKGFYLSGPTTGTGNLTIKQSGLDTGNANNAAFDGSTVHFSNTGAATANTYSGTVTVTPIVGGTSGGSYLQLDGTNALANATINLTGVNSASNDAHGASSLLFGSGLGTVVIGGLSGAGSFTLADQTPTTPAAVALTVNDSNATPLTYSGVLSGAGSLTKSGTGTEILTGTNTYTGATTISAGTLQLGNGTTDGTIATTSGVTDNATLAYNWAGNHTAGYVIGGTGNVTKSGAGTATLSGANTYSGGTVINGGTLQLSGSGTLGATTGSLTFTPTSAATLDLNGTNQGVGLLSGTTGIGGGTILNNGTGVSTLTIGTGNATGGTYADTIADNSGTGGTVAITKTGSGTETFTGNNTYTSGTTFGGGILNVGSANALGTGGTLSFTGGTLQYSSANTNDYSPRFSPANGQAYSVDTNGQTVSFGSNIGGGGGTNPLTPGGNGTFTKLGSGTLNFTSDNTYTGTTTASAGVLNLNDPSGTSPAGDNGTTGVAILGTESSNSAINDLVVAGGTVNLLTDNQIGQNDSVLVTSGFLNFGSANQTLWSLNQTGGGINFGTGNVTINDPTINNNNTYSGNTSFGTLTVTGSPNTVTGSSTGGAGRLTVGSSSVAGGLQFQSGGTGSPTLTANADAATPGIIRLTGTNGNVTVGTGASPVNAFILTQTGGTANPGELDLNGASRTVTINPASTLSVTAQVVDHTGTGTGAGAVVVTGGGTLTLSNTNTYTGGTTVGGSGTTVNLNAPSADGTGALVINGDGSNGGSTTTTVVVSSIGNTSGSGSALGGGGVTLGGGTLQNGNPAGSTDASGVTPNSTNFQNGGVLTLSPGTTSFLDFGAGNSGAVFNFSSLVDTSTGNTVLDVLNWNGNFGVGATGGDGLDQFFIGTSQSLSTAQLNDIVFINPDGIGSNITAGQLLDGEISPAPEPAEVATLSMIGLGLGGLLLRARKRLMAAASQALAK